MYDFTRERTDEMTTILTKGQFLADMKPNVHRENNEEHFDCVQ